VHALTRHARTLGRFVARVLSMVRRGLARLASFVPTRRARRMLGVAGLAAVALVFSILAVSACGTAPKPTPAPVPTPPAPRPVTTLRGLATFYGDEQHGGPTASGERFNKNLMTAAHRTLPMGTRVRVTNTRNGRAVVVRINDRGPYGNNRRIIDVSEAAARRLGMIEAGVVPVVVEVLP